MKSVILLVLIGLFFIVNVMFYMNNNPGVILSKKELIENSFSAKRLYYTIYLFGFFPVGQAVISDDGLMRDDGQNLYKLSALAKAVGIIAKVYSFNASINSYLEPNTFLPLFYKQEIKTPDKTLAREIYYNQVKNTIKMMGEERAIFADTYEPLSAMFWLRRTDLESKEAFDLNINTNQKNYAFAGTVAKRPNKKHNVYLLKGKIFRRDKSPYHRSSVDIVLAGNKVKTPVLIKVFASGAYIIIKLTKSE